MSALCRVGLHRWKPIGYIGLSANSISECIRCGKGKVWYSVPSTQIVSAEFVEQAKRCGNWDGAS